MASNDLVDYDLESPLSAGLSQVISKSDDVSVSTHQSDSDSDVGSHRLLEHGSNSKKWRTVLFVAVLGAVLGLTIGLGVGLTVGKQSSSSVAFETTGKAASVAFETTGKAASVPPASIPPVTNAPVSNGTVEFVEATTPPVQSEVPTTQAPTQPAQNETKPPVMIIGFGSGFGSSSTGNVSWPQLVGLPATEAKQIIEDENAGYDVIIVGPNEPTTKDLRNDRVFLYTNQQGYVTQVPIPGR